MRRRFPEMQKLISKAMTDLGTHNQPGMVGDVFEIYYKEHVQKMKGSEDDIKKVEDKYLYDLCELLIKYCEEVRSAHILTQVAQQCVSDGFQQYNSLIAGHIGDLHSKNLLNSKAYVSICFN